jgi:hypothetical protein
MLFLILVIPKEVTVGSPSLTINFATTSSNGVYKCFATNAIGTGASNPTTLTITGG